MTELRIRLSLVENATDSLTRAIQSLTWNDHGLNRASKFKQSVQLAAHGLELILKARLHQIHPSLVWENIDRYPDLDARTVGSEQAIQRLERIGGLVFSTDDKALLRSLRRARNAIEHLAWDISEHEATVLITRGLHFAVAFSIGQLGLSLVEYGSHKDGLLEDFLAYSNADATAGDPNRFSRTGFAWCEMCRGHTLDSAARSCTSCGYTEEAHDRVPAVWDADDVPF